MGMAHLRALRRTLDVGGTSKCVLYCLADHADDCGATWISARTIAAETEFSERAVKSALRSLQDRRLLGRRSVEGRTAWVLSICGAGDAPTGAGAAPTNTVHELHQPVQGVHGTVQEMHPNGAGAAPKAPRSPKKQQQTESGAPKRKTRLPEDFTLTDERRHYARRWMPEDALEREFEKFRNHYLGAGTAWLDWDRVWQKWAAGYRGAPPSSTNGAQRYS